MVSRALPWLLGLGLLGGGFGAGLAVRAHAAQAAEDRAHRAQGLYQKEKAAKEQANRDRADAWIMRATTQRRLDSAAAAQSESLTVVQSRAKRTQAKLAAAETAAAKECPESCVRYRELYSEAADQYRSLLSINIQQQRALADLRAMAATDSASIRREEARGDRWETIADSLSLANADLLKHRRPGFSLKLGVGGFALGAAVGAIACAVAC